MRARPILSLVLLLSLGLLTAPLSADEDPLHSDSDDPTRTVERDWEELTEADVQTIRSGLAYLARTQKRGGYWISHGPHQTAITALCGLALVAGGNSLDRGRYAEEVRRTVRWIIDQQGRVHPGLIAAVSEDRHMYSHGFSMLFLSEVYGMGGRPSYMRRIKKALTVAVEVTAGSQSGDGGWHYRVNAGDDEGSVTIVQVQALRAARNAGIHVPADTMDNAVDYVRRSQDKDTGGIRYTVRYGKATPALTAAGLSVFYQAGDYDSPHIERALDYMRREHLRTDFENQSGHFFYTQFYAAQAYHQAELHSDGGTTIWRDYFPRIRDELRRRQNKALGCWGAPYGQAYGTAFALLVLQVPLRYLPTYER